jgi:hypothetical protein
MQPEKVEARNGGNRPSLGNQIDRPQLNNRCKGTSQASPHAIALAQFDWGHPNELQTQWLTSKGVDFEALLKPWPIGATRVRFEDGYFIPDEAGERVITIVCFDSGVPIDIVAWQPKTDQLATYLGRAVFLGDEDDCFNPATWFGDDDLIVHTSPMDWLRANREGVVVIDQTHAGEILRRVQSVRCSDDEMAATVHRWLSPAEPSTKIFVSAPKRFVA